MGSIWALSQLVSCSIQFPFWLQRRNTKLNPTHDNLWDKIFCKPYKQQTVSIVWGQLMHFRTIIMSKRRSLVSSCQDNTQFYYNLIHVICILLSQKYFFCIFVFIYIRSLFSHLFVYIYFYLRFFTPHFLKIADWQSKAQFFFNF